MPTAVDHSHATPPVSRNLWWIAVVLAVVGFCLSVYSVQHHLELRANGQTNALCNINSQINCDAVASSKYAEFLGIPIGVFGAGYFLAMLFLAGTTVNGHKTRREHEPTWFIMAGLGVLVSLVLGTISYFLIGKLCVVCIATYIVTFLQAILAFALLKDGEKRDFIAKYIGNGLTTSAVAVALAVVVFNFMKPAAQLPKELQDLPGKVDSPLDRNAALLPTAKEIPINRTPYSGAGEDYRLGGDDAKVVVVEFADYQCPACAEAKKTIDELAKMMGDSVLIVFKNFPLSNQCNSGVQSNMHPYSCDIARLARCAGQYGKFWEFHRMAFDEQPKASLEQAKEWGRRVGMTDPQMTACLNSAEILAKIRDDIDVGNRAGVDGTPTIFINGRKYVGGRSAAAIRAAIESMR